jgi:hypothetical protein
MAPPPKYATDLHKLTPNQLKEVWVYFSLFASQLNKQLRKLSILASHLGDLRAPVQQDFRSYVLAMILNIVAETTKRHQLRYDHHSCRHADCQYANAVLVVN